MIDGYLYYPAWINPPERIALARRTEWLPSDVLLCSYPKNGSHFLLLTQCLIVHKGALPEKTDLHTLCYAPEFAFQNNHTNPIDASHPPGLPLPRIMLSRMPQHHVRLNDVSRYVYVVRDPVAALASLRRMEYLMFGPHLIPSIEKCIEYNLHTRESGWLNHVLGWWAVRDMPNVLILSYEDMVRNPAECVRRLAAHTSVELTDEQVQMVVHKMSKEYALVHVDPYHNEAKTPFSPPEAIGSNFIVADGQVKERLSLDQERGVRSEFTRKIRAVMADNADPARASNAASFFAANRAYFDP